MRISVPSTPCRHRRRLYLRVRDMVIATGSSGTEFQGGNLKQPMCQMNSSLLSQTRISQSNMQTTVSFPRPALLAASATPPYREGASLVNTSCWQVRHLDSLGTGAAMAAMFAGV